MKKKKVSTEFDENHKLIFGDHALDPRTSLLRYLFSYLPGMLEVRNGIADDYNKEQNEVKKADYNAQLVFVEFYLKMLCGAILVEKDWLNDIKTSAMRAMLNDVLKIHDVLEDSEKDFKKRFDEAARQGKVEVN